MFDSRAHNQPGGSSILRSDRHEWAVPRFSGDVKYSASADTLELGWTDSPPFDLDLLVVKVEQYVTRRGHPLLRVFGGKHWVRGAAKRLLMNLTLRPGDFHLCPRCRIAEYEIERLKTLVIWSLVFIDLCPGKENTPLKGAQLTFFQGQHTNVEIVITSLRGQMSCIRR